MSIISTSTEEPTRTDEVMVVSQGRPVKKVLEEDDYLERMARIIRRDFFPDVEFPEDEVTSHKESYVYPSSDRTSLLTPGTHRTQYSSSSIASKNASTSLRLNDFLDKFTSEDNAYFDKLQKKELRRHRAKYPWLYQRPKDQVKRDSRPSSGLELVTTEPVNDNTKSINHPYNPRNTLFYPPPQLPSEVNHNCTINYLSSCCLDEPKFKMPAPKYEKTRHLSRLSDKIGIDGKLINGSETPSINGYSFIPAPETPIRSETVTVKMESNRFYIPSESPRDEIAHRMYEEKVGKAIRTPKSSLTHKGNSTRIPFSSRRYLDATVTPGKVKITPKVKKE